MVYSTVRLAAWVEVQSRVECGVADSDENPFAPPEAAGEGETIHLDWDPFDPTANEFQRKTVYSPLAALLAFFPICAFVSLLQALFLDPHLSGDSRRGWRVLAANLGLSCALALWLTRRNEYAPKKPSMNKGGGQESAASR